MLEAHSNNCDCLTQTKKLELQEFDKNSQPDIIALTEIYPKNTIYDINETYYQITDYHMFMSSNESGRGIVIYTKCSLQAQKYVFNVNFKEQVWCKIQLKSI